MPVAIPRTKSGLADAFQSFRNKAYGHDIGGKICRENILGTRMEDNIHLCCLQKLQITGDIG